ncbi:SDR family oxidoreductase [Pendulispora rubella]|uniref:SDR family oxidoreductase n=1 Tax=Pendulispora rubella TaxID=2741070 RepID=A0ABZ2LLD0_9BACT
MIIQQHLSKELFRGKTVFITGGGSGINLGVARHFAALGANLAICGRTQERLDTAAAELRELNAHVGGKVLPVVADVRQYTVLEEAFARAESEVGSVDVLVAGAAGNFLCPAEDLSPNGFKTVIEIDLLGSFNASRIAFSQLRKTRGSILFISAAQALFPHALQAHVGAAKAGIDNLMRTLALEWGRYGIRSNGITPGPIADTEGMRRLSNPDHEARTKGAIPLGRYGHVDDIGQAAVYLASPLASYITGTLLLVDGGSSLIGSGLWNEAVEQMVPRKTPQS